MLSLYEGKCSIYHTTIYHTLGKNKCWLLLGQIFVLSTELIAGSNWHLLLLSHTDGGFLAPDALTCVYSLWLQFEQMF